MRQITPGDAGVFGYFGNIWVRQNFLSKAGDTNGGGHTHHFDHVSLLAQGSVRVEEGQVIKLINPIGETRV
jgi:hypothetical protein